MKNNKYFIAILSMLVPCMLYAQAQIAVPIVLSDGFASKELHFGLDINATDGIDTNLGEGDLPPLPPVGAFDARFHLPENNFNGSAGSWKDFRFSDFSGPDTTEHRIKFQTGLGTVLTISYDLPFGITGLLKDVFGGSIVNVPLTGNGNYLIADPILINELMIFIYYEEYSFPGSGMCSVCPGYNDIITPDSSWQTLSSLLLDTTGVMNPCKVYRFYAEAGKTYIFKTGCGNGATSTFDTQLELLDGAMCSIVSDDDNSCESGRSKIIWVAGYTGYAYIRVSENDLTGVGNFTLAYLNPAGCHSILQNPSQILTLKDYWQYKSGISPGEFSYFHVLEGTTYQWSLCSDYGGNAPFDSYLTLRSNEDNSILAVADNNCGNDAHISWTSDFTGMVKLVLTKPGCESGSESAKIAYKKGALEDIYLTLTPDKEVLSSSGTINFSVGSNTSWTLSKDASWISIVGPAYGTGSRNLTVHYEANTTSSQRVAFITASAPGLGFVSVSLTQYPSDGYCNSNLSTGLTFLPTTEWQYDSDIFAGMFATTPVVSGIQYHWSLCSMHGAAVLFDAELILRRADNNQFIAYSDGGCGFNDAPVISWVANFTGFVKIILANNTCEFGETARIGYKRGGLTIVPLAVHTEILYAPFTSGTTTFYVYSPLPWSITIPPSMDPGWISVNPQSGVGNTQVTVTYLTNQTNLQRSGFIVVNAGSATAQVTLIQMPDDGHCNSISKSGALLNVTENWQYKDSFLAGDYQTFAVESGKNYHWSLCPLQGGEAAFNSALTLRRAHDNSFISFNDNTCGDDARISWTSDYTGDVKLVLMEFPCNATQNPARLAYKSGPLVNPYPNPPTPLLTPVLTILSPRDANVGYILTINTNTLWELSTEADWITLNQTSGIGDATITVFYEPNNGAERTAYIAGSIPYMPGVFSDNTVIQTDYCTSETYLTTAAPTELWKYINCVKAGEYVVFPVVEGEKYQWSFSGQHGGNSDFHSELTLRKLSDNSFIAYSSDYNGNGQDAYILWTAEFTGNVKLVCTELDCQTSNQSCSRLAYKKGDLNFPYLQFDQSIHYAESGSGSIELNIHSNTSWSLQKDVAWINPLIPNNGSGNATITVSYLQNPCLQREGTITGSAFGVSNVNMLLIQEANLLTVPSAYAGFDATILSQQNYQIKSASAANYNNLLWSSNGSGYFSDPTIVNPTYIPGPGEFGQITLSLSVFGAPGCSFTSSSVLSIVQGIPIELDINVMLEGPFVNNQMTTGLNSSNFIPLAQPYFQPPWSYPGFESVPVIPIGNVVDWVYVELRHSDDEPDYFEPDYTVIDRKAGFLLANGNVRDLDGVSLLNMLVADPVKTRVAVWHRNHISVLSSAVIQPVSGNVYQWNFTNGLSKAFNLGQKPLGNGFFGMIAGDGNADGKVDFYDESETWKPHAGKKGYYQGDYDANSEVDNKDKNNFWYPNRGAGTQVPQ